ncbi:MAG: hypothetical protein Q9171_003625 [Xanthocarpia ochracea]
MQETDGEAEDNPTDLPELSHVIESSLPAPSPPKKRRKVDTTNPLTRPFKSPLRTPLKPISQHEANATTPASISDTLVAEHHQTFTASTPTTLPTTPRLNRPLSSFSSSSPAKTGSTLDKLQKHHTHLLNTLSSLRARLEITTQALEIEASNTDAELEGLIEKWTRTSREAAEEVFVAMKEKVDGMGGWRKWRSTTAEGRSGWDDAGYGKKPNNEDYGSDGEEEGKEQKRERRRRERAEVEQAEKDMEEDEGFTMETMLQSLDIPLKTIGYDKELQRWND